MKTNLQPLLFILYFILGCTGPKGNQVQTVPEELSFLAIKDTIKTDSSLYINSFRYFIIKEKNLKKLKDSAFLPFVDTMNRNGITQAGFLFYKESNKTNAQNLKENRKDLDRYSQQNDLLFEYLWVSNQKKWLIFKYKDGQILIPDSKIKITDIH